MTSWIPLPKETAHSFYRVPLELASAEENSFFGFEHHPLDTDGPWPFLAFLKSENQPGVLTLQIFTIEAEALESKNFNPLTEICGYLSLNRRQLLDLVRLLRSYAERLPPPRAESQEMFKPIEKVRLKAFRLRSPLLPDSRDYFYYQTYDPAHEPTRESIATLLIFSAGQSPRPPPLALYFKIARFPLKALEEASFNPLDHSLPRIHLNRSGMEELARLLEDRQKEPIEER